MKEARYFAVCKSWIQEVDKWTAGEDEIKTGWRIWDPQKDELAGCLVRVGRGPYFEPIREFPKWVRDKVNVYIERYPERKATESHFRLEYDEKMRDIGPFRVETWFAVYEACNKE